MSGTGQKTNPLAATLQPYSQLVNNTSLQPSQVFMQYDPNHQVNVNQASQQSHAPGPPGGPSQNIATSQIIGSQLVQQRQVQNVGSVQPQTTFYSHNQQPLQQTGFYQQTTNLQVRITYRLLILWSWLD